MNPMRRLLSLTLAAASLAWLGACSDANLQKKEKTSTNVDDRLSISGRVCTSPPDKTGFPVKVIFIIDQSGSMCISDPPGSQESNGFCEMYGTAPPGVTQPARVRAMHQLLQQFANQPNVQVALVPFETNVNTSRVWPPPGGSHFARPDSSLDSVINSLQAELGKGTDYQGALAYAYGLIASDIEEVSKNDPALLPRTRYVTVFLTDGVPYPRCAGNDNLTQYADDLNPDLTWADVLTDFCNNVTPTDPDAITGFIQGTDRNQNYQLFSYVDQMMQLKDAYNVGDVRLHTVLLFNQESVTNCGPICQDIYGKYVRWPGPVPVADGPAAAKRIAKWTLEQLAQRGNGVFQEFDDFAGLGTLSLGALNYNSLSSRNVMKTLMVQALSSEPGATDRVVDTDGDGLPDDVDNAYTYQTSPIDRDTDSDGFDDRFEVTHTDDGFRATEKDSRGCDPNSVLTPGCKVRDTDGDGLSQYAEAYLKTNATLVDSDGDGIPDGLEVKYGLDPLTPQPAGLDTDGDGVPDLDEYRMGSNPIKRDPEFIAKNAYQYEVTSEVQSNGSICYDFTVSNLQLVTPPNKSGAGTQDGFNLFKVWFAEAPESGVSSDYGVWRTACVWAQYAPPSARIPAGPSAEGLVDSYFKAPQNLNSSSVYETNNCLLWDQVGVVKNKK
jgi:hypothetical protein